MTPVPSLQSPRRRATWMLAGLIGAVVASLGGLYVVKADGERRCIDRERGVLGSRLADLRSGRVLRPVFFEPAEEGNSWEPLARALVAIEAIPVADLAGFQSLREDEIVPEPAGTFKGIARVAPHVEDLKRALRRRWTEPDLAYEDHVGMKGTHTGAAIRTGRILTDAAKFLHGEGRSDEAVDFIMLALGLSDRIAVKGAIVSHLVSVVVQSLALDALKTCLSEARFDGSGLARLQKGVEGVSADRSPVMGALAREDLVARIAVVDFATRRPSAFDASQREGLGLARGSIRAMCATFLREQDRFMEEVGAAWF